MQHGVKRGQGPSEQDIQLGIAKAKKLRTLQAQVLSESFFSMPEDEAFNASANLAAMNPDLYSVWNRRRQLLQRAKAAQENQQSEQADRNPDTDESKPAPTTSWQDMVVSELGMTQRLLPTNPKSYSLWSQRLWCIELLSDPKITAREFALLAKMLKADERNFHAWAYRLMLCRIAAKDCQEELDHATAMIEGNFSNFSAWHFRALYLQLLAAGRNNNGSDAHTSLSEFDLAKLADMAQEDSEMCHSAFYTDPFDQSSWIHHKWLLSACGPRQVTVGMHIRNTSDDSENWQVALSCSLPLVSLEGVKLFDTDGEEMEGSFNALAWCDGHSPTEQASLLKASARGSSHACMWRWSSNSTNGGDGRRPSAVLFSSGSIRAVGVGGSSFLAACSISVGGDSDLRALNSVHIVPCCNAQGESIEPILDIQAELQVCAELREVEPDCRWVMLQMVDLYEFEGMNKEAKDLLQELQRIDPARIGYYKDRESSLDMLAAFQARLAADVLSGNLDLQGFKRKTIPRQLLPFVAGADSVKLDNDKGDINGKTLVPSVWQQ